MFTARPATRAPLCTPGIYFDEVHRHPVCVTPGQNERFLDVVSASFDIVAATDIPKLAACGDFAAVPALEIVWVVKVRSNRERCCKQKLSIYHSRAGGYRHGLFVGRRLFTYVFCTLLFLDPSLLLCLFDDLCLFNVYTSGMHFKSKNENMATASKS